MSTPEAAVSFRELFAYTDFLAGRWISYFEKNPTALDVNIGGRTGTIRELVHHIFAVEQFFASRVLQKEAPTKIENASLDDVARLHKTAHSQLMDFAATANEEALSRKHVFGTGSHASSRKMLTQAALHSVHHWAQVAMEVRQAGFPTEKPQDIIITNVME